MTWLDWLILLIFLAGLIGLGFHLSGQADGKEGFFLSNRNMPWWAASISIIGTALSAGTFVGVPQVTYTGDLTWMMLLVGSTVGGVLAALLIVPVLYRAGTLTIYGYLRNRFGPRTEVASAWFFLGGLLLSAGARHFIASIVVSLMIFGSIGTHYLLLSIVLLGIIATCYTAAGGIRAVIWTDLIQVTILAGTAILCIYLIFDRVPLDAGGLLEVLRTAPEGNKLRFWNAEFRLDQPYTVWAAVGAYAILSIAQYGCDHDMVQRMLTCKSAWKASLSMIVSRLIQVPIVILFLIIGSLLYVFYLRPDVMGDAAVLAPDGTREIFPHFILEQLPPGLLGLALIGMLAASMSSFDSAVNAMASTIHGNLKRGVSESDSPNLERKALELMESRRSVIWMGILLTLFAALAVFLQQAGGKRLIDFALGVLTFSYAGLFGVFMTAVFTRRGNERSAVMALWAGAVVVLAVQPYLLPRWSALFFSEPLNLAWPWWMVAGGGISFFVCILGRGTGCGPNPSNNGGHAGGSGPPPQSKPG